MRVNLYNPGVFVPGGTGGAVLDEVIPALIVIANRTPRSLYVPGITSLPEPAEPAKRDIVLRYVSVDRVRQRKRFKSLKGARAWAQRKVGEHPDMGRDYAVSFDGIGTVRVVEGTTLAELFPSF